LGERAAQVIRKKQRIVPEAATAPRCIQNDARALAPKDPLAARIDVVDVSDLGIDETGEEAGLEQYDTFEENALAKARYFARISDLPTVADDSGLEVDSLAGRPGVRSKRWSGREDIAGQALDDANNATLLAALEHESDRRGRYVCVAAFVDGDGEVVTRGETAGELLREARGSEGFGYDPYFFSAELARTFGEASLEEKQRVSHRGRAFRELLELIRARR
jgi:XTP/dITP diphosphohydrolase